MMERTLVLIKPDGVQRSLTGRILTRFEDIGLKVVGMKMVWSDDKMAETHYAFTDEWANSLFERVKSTKEKNKEPFPFTSAKEYGLMIQRWNKDYLTRGPIVAIVLEGSHAVELVRKHIGHTEPRQALPGTIRGDFTVDSYYNSDVGQRSIYNLVHASGTANEANREIALWFNPKELHSYKNLHDHAGIATK